MPTPDRTGLASLVLLLTLAGPSCDRDEPQDDDTAAELDPAIEALLGDLGVALFVGGAPADASIEGTAADLAVYPIPLAGETVVFDDRGTAETQYRLVDGSTVLADCEVSTLDVVTNLTPDPALLLAGESLTLDFLLDPTDLALVTGDLVVRRTLLPGGAVTWLDPGCLDTPLDAACWLSEPAALTSADTLASGATVMLHDHAPDHTEVQVELIELLLRTTDGAGTAFHAGGGARATFLGSTLRWGDPHAHSNLSHDGCEDPQSGCGNRGDVPAEDFFANAVAAELDFAALTDHGEWYEIQVDEQTEWLLWDETLARVDEALVYEDQGFVPLLGYEWTSFLNPFDIIGDGDDPEDFADEFVRGHKTVLFRDPAACESWRVGANTILDVFPKGDTGLVYHTEEDRPEAVTTSGLHDYWDLAAAECGDLDVLTFFHHPAYLFPNPVNWALAINVPDVNVEMLVEIASEHGSSECRDVAQDGCDFWLNESERNHHLSWGSVQEALTLGYRLGFVGGTDGHDGRPGSLDEPSTIAAFWDADGDGEIDDPQQQFTTGAITGVWVGGEFSRDALWEGLTSRHTLTTTGPRGRVAMAAIAADGTAFLPGDLVEASRFPLDFTAEVALDGEAEITALELVDPVDGAVIASADEGLLQLQLADPGSPALYLRVRAVDGDVEHRMWFSPLFVSH